MSSPQAKSLRRSARNTLRERKAAAAPSISPDDASSEDSEEDTPPPPPKKSKKVHSERGSFDNLQKSELWKKIQESKKEAMNAKKREKKLEASIDRMKNKIEKLEENDRKHASSD